MAREPDRVDAREVSSAVRNSPRQTRVLVDDHEIIVHGLTAMLAPYRHRLSIHAVAGEIADMPAAIDVGAGVGGVSRIALIDPFDGPHSHAARVTQLRAIADRVAYFTLDPAGAERLLTLGNAEAVISKAAPGAQIAADLVRIAQQPCMIVTADEGEPVNALDSLSQREHEVLNLVSHGCSNQEIAHTMFISIDTVKTYLRRVYAKLGVDNRTRAALLAVAART